MATRYGRPGGGNWSAAGTWSATSGGASDLQFCRQYCGWWFSKLPTILKIAPMLTLLRAILIGLCIWSGPAWAGSMALLGVGGSAPTSTYQGIGDILAANSLTATAAYGTQAYSAATRGNKLIQACNSTGGTDVSCADLLSDATTGLIVPQVISGITCPGNANCTVRIFYDLSGAAACSGACNIMQATVASRTVLMANAVSTNACPLFSGASTIYGASAALASPVAQPWGMLAIGERTGAFTSAGIFIGDGTSGSALGFQNAANTARLYAGSSISQSGVADSTFHVIQGLASGASSFLYTDGTASSTGNPGTSSLSGVLHLGSDVFSNKLTGYLCSVAIYSGTSGNLSASQSPMNSKMHSNWGF